MEEKGGAVSRASARRPVRPAFSREADLPFSVVLSRLKRARPRMLFRGGMPGRLMNVKICGITRLEDALLAEEMGASAIGYVFYEKSPRFIPPGKAADISRELGPFIAKVGVFVDEEPERVMKAVETAGLTAVQLHGSEDAEYIGRLGRIPVIKAFRVSPDFDTRRLGEYDVGAYLLDAYVEKSYGGTGRTFDWRKARECRGYGRIIIAGGLDETNVDEAVTVAEPWGLDVSSGVEKCPGIKDAVKMRKLFDALSAVRRFRES